MVKFALGPFLFVKLTRPSINVYVSAVCGVAIAMLVQADWSLSSEIIATVATLLLIAIISEAGSHRVGVGTVTSSVAFIPFLASIVLLGPEWAMAIGGMTLLISSSLFRRKSPVKVVFNGAKEVIAIGAAAHVYVFLGGVPSQIQFTPAIFSFLLAIVTYFALDQIIVAEAIALSTQTKVREAWGRMALHQVIDLGTSSLALLLTFLYVQLNLWGALLVIIPVLLARHVYVMALRFEQVNRDLLELMVKSIEARDPYTSGHSVRVSRLARTMAEELGLSSRQIDNIAAAALLHDLGKMYQEFAPILRKESKLDAREMRLMQLHPVRGAELVGTVSSLRGEVQQAVRHHHEGFGGKGYPDRLKGEEIPLAARIISVVDTFDAMTSTRPYRKGLSRETAVAELKDKAGRQFDPALVELFCSNARMLAVVSEQLDARHEPKMVPVGDRPDRPDQPVPNEELARAGRRRWIRHHSMQTRVENPTSAT